MTRTIGVLMFASLMVCVSIPALGAIDFVDRQTVFSDLRAAEMVAGDVEGDGDLDLIVVNTGSSNVNLFLNDGAGDFAEMITVDLPEDRRNPQTIGAGDINGDGLLDLVVGIGEIINTSSQPFQNLGALIGMGQEGYVYEFEFNPLSGLPASILVTDIDADGDNDVVIGGKGLISFGTVPEIVDPGVSIFYNQGNGALGPEIYISSNNGEISDLAVGEVNGDGLPDLIAASQGSFTTDLSSLEGANIHFYVSSPDGLTASPGSQDLAFLPNSIAQKDFNDDGLTDYAVSILGSQSDLINFTGRDASVSFFQHDGFDYQLRQQLETPGITYSAELADFDMDGDLDAAVTLEIVSAVGPVSPQLIFYENTGGFAFEEAARFEVGDLPRYTESGDFDGDGDIDVAVLSVFSDEIFDAPVNGFVYIYENQAVTHVSGWALY